MNSSVLPSGKNSYESVESLQEDPNQVACPLQYRTALQCRNCGKRPLDTVLQFASPIRQNSWLYKPCYKRRAGTYMQ